MTSAYLRIANADVVLTNRVQRVDLVFNGGNITGILNPASGSDSSKSVDLMPWQPNHYNFPGARETVGTQQ